MRLRKSSLIERRNRVGYLYIAPWIIGFVFFFIMPVIKTGIYSFHIFDKNTLVGTFAGLKNFEYALMGDAQFPQILAKSLLAMIDVPLILIFSYFVALLLRNKFRGATAVKVVFFLTVILSSDLFLRMQAQIGDVNNAQMNVSVAESQQMFSALEAVNITKYISALGIPSEWVSYINDAISNIFSIMIRSGVQIFIFIAALHNIPSSMYEAANVEGSTEWENFWKITLPMTSPIIMVNCIYTIVDSFGSYLNPVITYINNIAFKRFEFGYSSALSWIYFICIAVIIATVYFIFRKKIFYQT